MRRFLLMLAATFVAPALAHTAYAQHRWQTIEVPGTPSGMLQYDVATVMRTQAGNLVSVWERINRSGEGTGGWKLPIGKRYAYAYQVTHFTFDCPARTGSLGAIGYFDAAGHLIEGVPALDLDGLEAIFLPATSGTWEAATMQAVCGP